MTTVQTLIALAALVGAATALGLAWKTLNGRSRTVTKAPALSVHDLGADLGATATLVQFSSEVCSACASTRRVLGGIANGEPGTAHIELDVAARPDLAQRFNILQTPTTLVLDSRGEIRARIGGAARPDAVRAEINRLVRIPA